MARPRERCHGSSSKNSRLPILRLPRTQSRLSKTAGRLTALVTTATLTGATAAQAHQMTDRPLSTGTTTAITAIARAERSIRDWERPWDVMLAVHRLALVPGQGATQAAVLRFDIAAGPIADVVRAFERLTGVTVTLPPDLMVINSPGVSGAFTAEEALAKLLAGTGLSHRFVSPTAADIQVRVENDVVEVRGKLPEVSSLKFSQPLLDTPQTVLVVPRAAIEAQGATTLRDVLRNVPGLTMQAGEGGGGLPGDSLSLRGFSASSDIFIDGMRDVGSYSRDSFNLEQVEVIKGPASTFGGRGSTGGAINLSTKAPMLESIRQGTVVVGNANTQRVTSGCQRGVFDVCGRQRGAVERDVAGRRRAGTRRRQQQELGGRAVALHRPRAPDARHVQLSARESGQRA